MAEESPPRTAIITTPASQYTQRRADHGSGIDTHGTPVTLEDHLKRIDFLTERILVHVGFIKNIGSLEGTSGEARQGAVVNFCARLETLERALKRIEDDLRLG